MLSLFLPICSSSPLVIPSPQTLSPIPKTLASATLTLVPSPLHKPYRRHSKSVCFSSSSLPSQPSPIEIADLVEKDYSFLDSASAIPQHSRIVAAAGVGDDSRVLISFPTVGFVERVAASAHCELIAAVHDSLFVLAMIKESNDAVRCLQGGILDVVPKRFLPLDVVFANFFPAMGVSIDELVGSAAKWCSPGGRLVISFDQGRDIIEREYRRQHPDIVTAALPDKITLEKAATDHSFKLTEYVDEPGLYLAVLNSVSK